MRHFAVVLALASLGVPAGATEREMTEAAGAKPVVSADASSRSFFDRFAQSNITCFKSGENISGMNKICFYDCLGSAVAITIKSIELCPLSIKQ